jgi:hypothetical protein
MGWRSKLLFLLVVYFAGFATAIYYLAPSGTNSHQTDSYKYISDKSSGTATGEFCDKALNRISAGFSSMKSKEFKDRFNQGVQKLMEMAKPSSASAAQGGEDK